MKCIYCGEETENIIDDEYVCLNCMNKLKGDFNMKCIYCGEETENIIDDEYVCLNCMNKLYVPLRGICGVMVKS